MPGLFDHLLAALLLVAWPVASALRGRSELRELEAAPEDRLPTYRRTILLQWLQAAAILGLWLGTGRPWSALGLGLRTGWGFGAAAVFAAVTVWLLARQLRVVRRDPVRAERLREQVAELQGMIPQTPRELRAFRAMAVTAGICEELAYRGFALWYLSAYVPFPVAVALMMVAFGACHLYQGAPAALQVAGIAAVAAFLYWLSGSLWIPMLLHAFFDLNQLAIARAALQIPAPAQAARPHPAPDG